MSPDPYESFYDREPWSRPGRPRTETKGKGLNVPSFLQPERNVPGVGMELIELPLGENPLNPFVQRPRPRSISSSRTRPAPDPTPITIQETDGGDGRGPGRPVMLRVDPLCPQDVTVHMSLPVRDDLEDVLEECSRLRRLGHFATAIALFQDRLEHFLDNRYILVQYAQCLFEAGQYGRLQKLAEERRPQPRDPPDALQLNWDLLLLAAGIGPYFARSNVHRILPAITPVLMSAWPRLDSTEVCFRRCHRASRNMADG